MGVSVGDIKRGDWVTIGPFRVEDVGCVDGNFSMHLPYGLGEYWMDVGDIVAIVPAPRVLEIGQQVLKMEDIYGAAVTGPWVVIGIHKQRVWLGAPEGERETYAQTTRDNLKYMDGTEVEP